MVQVTWSKTASNSPISLKSKHSVEWKSKKNEINSFRDMPGVGSEHYSEHEETGIDAKDNEEQSDDEIQTSGRDNDVENIQENHEESDYNDMYFEWWMESTGEHTSSILSQTKRSAMNLKYL